MSKTTNKILAALMIVFILFTFLPITSIVSYAGETHTHDWDTKVVYTDNDCTKGGETVKTCKTASCGVVEKTPIVAKANHTWDTSSKTGKCTVVGCEVLCAHPQKTDSTTPSTCLVQGKITTTCNDCQKVLKEEKLPLSTTHSYTDKDGDTPSGKCAICKAVCTHTDTTEVPKSAVAATCTTDGHEIDTKCNACGKTITGKTITKFGHNAGDWEWETSAPADCKTGGKMIKKCTICDVAIEGAEKTVKLSHTYGDVQTTPATCIAKGKKYIKCTVTGCNDEVILEELPIDKTNHTFSSSECSLCGAPDCGKDKHTYNKETGKCTKCGNLCAHSDKITKIVDSTCVKEGSAVETCKTCGKVTSELSLSKLATHAWETTYRVDKEATCKQEGIKSIHCKDCGEVEANSEINLGLGDHSWVKCVEVSAATCTENQKVANKCSVCGEIDAKTIIEVENSAAHEFVNKVVKATTTKNGSIDTVCSVCGEKSSTVAIAQIKTVALSTTSYRYDGKTKKPSVTVKDSKGKTIASSNYTVTYSKNTSIGTASVKVTFKGNYSGTVTKTFVIAPAVVTGVKTSATTGTTVSVRWTKAAGSVSNYEVAVYRNGKYVKTVKATGTSVKVTGLKAKTTYTYKVRAKKVVSGKTYTGAYTKTYTVKTK